MRHKIHPMQALKYPENCNLALAGYELEDFTRGKAPTLPDFSPFARLHADLRSLSRDTRSKISLDASPAFVARAAEMRAAFAKAGLNPADFSVSRLKSKTPHLAHSCCLALGDAKCGYLYRHPEGCDTLCLRPDLSGLGLGSVFLIEAIRLRYAAARWLAEPGTAPDPKILFNGGSFTRPGLACLLKAWHAETLWASPCESGPGAILQRPAGPKIS